MADVLNFCVNCRMFGDPVISHRGDCMDSVCVGFTVKQIGWYCPRCGRVQQSEERPRCECSDDHAGWTEALYEYPKELRRS